MPGWSVNARMHEALTRPRVPVLHFYFFANQQSAINFLYVILQIKCYYFAVLAVILHTVSQVGCHSDSNCCPLIPFALNNKEL